MNRNLLLLLLFGLALWSCEENNEFILLSPNGDEVWTENTTQLISWEAPEHSSGNIRNESADLFISYDSGKNWVKIWESNGDIRQSYYWDIPSVYMEKMNCKIKVVDSDEPSNYDMSDEDFTISLSDRLVNIVSPNGDEKLHEQTTQEIIWYSTGDIGGENVKIGYSIDGGMNWSGTEIIPIAGGWYGYGNTSDPPNSMWVDVPNSGSYDWGLPNFSDPIDSCLIGIWSSEDSYIYDTNDNYYSITSDSNYYQIFYPNGGEILNSGTECQITWNVGGDVGDIGILYYSIYGGESWYLIDSGSSPYTWIVPQVQGSNDACRIKIVSGENENWADISDANFTISSR